MTTQPLTDTHLWQALKQGDRQAFAELYQRHYRSLYSYGYRILSDAASVEDAIQDLFVDVWRMRQNLADVDSVKFYLFRSLRRQLHRLSEKEKRLFDTTATPTDTSDDQTAEQAIVEQEHGQQLTQRLAAALNQLPERQLEVVSLRFYENFKTDEIAAIMGITEKSVRNTLHKALTHLREQAHLLAPLVGLLVLWLIS